MSIVNAQIVSCKCGARVELDLADSIHVDRHPHLRQRLLDGELHSFTCLACLRTIVIDKQLFYYDHARRQFLCAFPMSELGNADACDAITRNAFDQALGSGAPPVLQVKPEQYLLRTCFGLDELRDKIRIDDAKLNDLVVEELKCQVMANTPALQERGVIALWLRRVAPDGSLEFLPEATQRPAPEAGPGAMAVSRAFYDDVAALGHEAILAARPGLAWGSHVSMRRLWMESRKQARHGAAR